MQTAPLNTLFIEMDTYYTLSNTFNDSFQANLVKTLTSNLVYPAIAEQQLTTILLKMIQAVISTVGSVEIAVTGNSPIGIAFIIRTTKSEVLPIHQKLLSILFQSLRNQKLTPHYELHTRYFNQQDYTPERDFYIGLNATGTPLFPSS